MLVWPVGKVRKSKKILLGTLALDWNLHTEIENFEMK
jgi:hypothetical protein